MAVVDTDNLISISEISNRGVSHVVREAEDGRDFVVLRNNRPVAMLVSFDRYDEFQRLKEDLADIALAAARQLIGTDKTTSLDTVLASFGVSRDELSHLDDDEDVE